MKVEITQVPISSAFQPLSAQGAGDANFELALNLARQNSSRDSTAATPREKTIAAPDALKTAQDELADYLSKPIAQHMRDAILKEMGLTEEDVQAMPPEKRAAVEASIAEKIKERMLEAQAKNAAQTTQNYGPASITLMVMAGQQQKLSNPYE